MPPIGLPTDALGRSLPVAPVRGRVTHAGQPLAAGRWGISSDESKRCHPGVPVAGRTLGRRTAFISDRSSKMFERLAILYTSHVQWSR